MNIFPCLYIEMCFTRCIGRVTFRLADTQFLYTICSYGTSALFPSSSKAALTTLVHSCVCIFVQHFPEYVNTSPSTFSYHGHLAPPCICLEYVWRVPGSRIAEPKGTSRANTRCPTALLKTFPAPTSSPTGRGGDLPPTSCSAFLKLPHFCPFAKWKRDLFFFFLQKNYISPVPVEVKHLFIPLFIFLFLLQ